MGFRGNRGTGDAEPTARQEFFTVVAPALQILETPESARGSGSAGARRNILWGLRCMSIQHVSAVLYEMPELKSRLHTFVLVAIADGADRESGWSYRTIDA